MKRDLRIGFCIPRDDLFWLQVEETIHRRTQRLPVSLVRIEEQNIPQSPTHEEQSLGREGLLSLELDALIGWPWSDSLAYAVLDLGLPIVHLAETTIDHPRSISPLVRGKAARMATRHIAEQLEGRGSMAVVGGSAQPRRGRAGRRWLDSVQQLAAEFPELHPIHIPCPWTAEEASIEIDRAMRALEEPVDAIFGLSDALALEARDVARALGIARGQTLVVGIDGDPTALEAIARGEMAATVAHYPEELGSQAADLAQLAAQGAQLPAHFEYGIELVTRDNLAEVATRRFVALSGLPRWIRETTRREQNQRLDELTTLLETANRIRSRLDAHRHLSEIGNLVCSQFGYDEARIYRWIEQEQSLVLVHPTDLNRTAISVGEEDDRFSSIDVPPRGSGAENPDRPGSEPIMIANGLGWVGEWYERTGEASNLVIDQIPGWGTAESKAFAERFEAKYGIKPGPAAAGLSHDYAHMFIQIAQEIYHNTGQLDSRTLAAFLRDELLTGRWSYVDGLIMEEYKYSLTGAPDPIVGKGYFDFPVLQYLDGQAMTVLPPKWTERAPDARQSRTRPPALAREPVTEVLKVGVLGPFTGPNARTGKEIRGGVEMALESIDYRIGRYKLEPVWIDSQANPEIAAQSYQKAIVQDGIQVGLLNWHTDVASACMEVAAEHQIPHFFALGAGSVVNEIWKSDPDRYFYWLKGWPAPASLTASYVQAFEEAIERGLWKPESKTAALWGDETAWGHSFVEGLKQQLTEAGWEIVSEDFFPMDQTDFVPLLTKIRGMNPVLFAGTGSLRPTYSTLIRQAGEVGLERLVLWSQLNGTSMRLDESGVLGQALLREEPIFVPNKETTGDESWEPSDREIGSRLVLPIRHGGEVLGVLDLRSRWATWHTSMELVALRTLADQLGMAIQNAELYGEAVEARAMAEKADRKKMRLLADVSHEMRTPLNVIIGYVQRALGSLEPERADLPPSLLNALRHVHSTAEHLLYVTGDLLDMSRAELDKLEVAPEFIDVRPVLIEAFESVADTSSAQIEWRLEVPDRFPMIKADPVRLRQILANLLHNADRFTKQGYIALGAEVQPPHLHLWVEDTGPGIPIEDQERIFEPFVTAQRTDGGREGIGLGLSIARRLVALHRGSIALESQPGKGSTFHVYLMLPNLLDERQPPLPKGRPVLLLISDREQVPVQIDDFCRRQGIGIRRVAATESPEELLGEAAPVALAWDMTEAIPGQLALIERLRAYPRLRRLPFICYGRRPDEDGETSLTNFVVKPVDNKTLLDAIEALCPFLETGPVLVVEDDPDVRRFLAGLVQEEYPGYLVRMAPDGRAAEELMEQQAPSLVILDLVMPETDGFQVLDWMRGRRETERVPVLVLTGHPLSMEDIRRLEKHAHVTVQSKGILTADELTAAVHRSLFGRDALPPQASALVKRSVAYVHENYARPFSRQELASALGVSEHHLSRIFRQELGLSPWEYLNRYRIYRAMDLLQRTNESITTIALNVGFEDSAYFSRVFRNKTGQSPSEYRASPGTRPW